MKRTRHTSWPSTVLAIIFLAIMIFPIYWMVNASFQSNSAAQSSTIFPIHPTLSGYRVALSQQGGNLVTSLIISLGTVVLSLAIATPAAYALAKFRIKGTNVIMLALLITQMIPGIVIANSLYTAFNNLHLLNNYFGLILADASNCIPFSVILISAFMRSIPDSLVEAARVDGAGDLRAFRSVVLPVSRNSVITAGLFSFLFTWSDFLFALTLTSTTAVRPVTLGIYNYLSANVQQWAPVMATAVLASIPAMVLLLAAQKYIAAGALGGAIK
ncbi:MAG TPA: carbohydrate ABC transporter permease [Microbacteriaceae bacterium]|nr:carbohydrate ABC transporter permease [Microbacteriaceae bacterium]